MNTDYFKQIGYIMLTIVLAFVAIEATFVRAESVIRSEEEVSLSNNQVIEGDFYTLSEKVFISGEVKGDLLSVSASDISINGAVMSDALLIGSKVGVYGSIGDDLRVLAGSVNIASPVTGDAFIVASEVKVLSTASVAGDLIVFGDDVVISGPVSGNISGKVSNLRIDASVTGDIRVTVGNLVLGDQAKIDGGIQYVSHSKLTQGMNAVVAGEIIQNDPVVPEMNNDKMMLLFMSIVLFFSVLVWYWFSHSSLKNVVNRSLAVSLRPLFFGFSALVLGLFAIIILGISRIGFLLALVMFLAYVLLILLSICAMPATLGTLLIKVFDNKRSNLSLLSIVVGVLGMSILMLLSFVGFVLLSILFLVTLGSLVQLVISLRKLPASS